MNHASREVQPVAPLRLEVPVVLLVDEHPLDAYLAAAAISAPEFVLVHTPERAGEAREQLEILGRRLGRAGWTQVLEDATSPVSARLAYAQLPPDCHLHHTGGDGSMAANLRAEHAAAGRPLESASCLDEERRILRLDDGVDLPLVGLVDPQAVNIESLLELSEFRALEDGDREALALAGHAVLDAAWPLPWQDVVRLAGDGRTAIEFLRRHLDRFRPSGGALAHDGRWQVFRSGVFLELVVERFVREVAPEHETRSGVRLERSDGMRAEIDVLSVGHYRPYVYSCSTSDNLETAKRKAFELRVRAGQVGGLTARSIVVTALVDEAADQLKQIATVDTGDDAAAVKVLGVSDLVAAGLEDSGVSERHLLGLADSRG